MENPFNPLTGLTLRELLALLEKIDAQRDGEAETRQSLAEGHGITFPNAEEAIKWLKSEKQEKGGTND